MTDFTPAAGPTMYFIGVSTGKSSIMDVFPAWADALGIDATISGIDLPLDAPAEAYREVVSFIKHDPLSLGALVTTHKLNIVTAARDLFDAFGDDAQLLGEISSIAKREGAAGSTELWGNAMDPVTSGLSLEAIVDDTYWSRTGGELVLLGAGGSSLALTLYLHKRMLAGHEVPQRIVVTNRRPGRLDEMRAVHERLGSTLPIEYVEAPEPAQNDAVVAGAREASVVVNATGLGKDRPGSPLTDAVVFPARSVAWDFNYRGDLVFLDQARTQEPARDIRVVDGWFYFLHGWTRVIADVFHLDIPTHGPDFERLSELARTAGKKGIPA